MIKPWHMGTHLRVPRELSNENEQDRVKMVFKKFLHPCALDKCSLGRVKSIDVTYAPWLGLAISGNRSNFRLALFPEGSEERPKRNQYTRHRWSKH